MKYFVLVFAVLFLISPAFADQFEVVPEVVPEADTDAGFQFAPLVSTDVPLFLGGGLAVSHSSFELDLQYGLTPEAYYNLIGDGAAQIAGNPSYSDVIKAAFQNNEKF